MSNIKILACGESQYDILQEWEEDMPIFNSLLLAYEFETVRFWRMGLHWQFTTGLMWVKEDPVVIQEKINFWKKWKFQDPLPKGYSDKDYIKAFLIAKDY